MGLHLAVAFKNALRRVDYLFASGWSVSGLESVVANGMMLTSQWTQVAAWEWRRSPHINVLEVSAALRLLVEVLPCTFPVVH